MGTRGFITVATGKEQYFKIAANLLKSYRLFVPAERRLPFAILADKENEYTRLFDQTIILENPQRSYMDKISLLINIPFDETVFIESDCLAYTDLNEYFDIFKDADEFSCIGGALALNSTSGWFRPEETGKYASQIQFVPRFHSAVIYLKKGKNALPCMKYVWMCGTIMICI